MLTVKMEWKKDMIIGQDRQERIVGVKEKKEEGKKSRKSFRKK